MFTSEVLTEEAQKLFPLLSHFKDSFYLAGGTALALQLGHRVSIDFDLFSSDPIKKTLLKKVEETYRETPELIVNSSNELTVIARGVKHTFLHYPFPPLLPLVSSETIELLSSKELLATKAYTIGRRGTLKDYVDLYVGMSEGVGMLTELIELAGEKYGNAFNDRLFLEQLLYLDDVEEVPLTMLNRALPTKESLRNFFSQEIAKIKL